MDAIGMYMGKMFVHHTVNAWYNKVLLLSLYSDHASLAPLAVIFTKDT